MKNKFTYLLFLLSGLLFAALVFILAYYNRLSTDEYILSYKVQKNGIVEFVYECYSTWTGRWSAMSLAALFYLQDNLFYSHLISTLLLCFGFFLMLMKLKIKYRLSFTKIQNFIFAVVVTALFFLVTPGTQGESWLWAQTPYLWSIISLVWGMTLIFKRKKYSLISLFIPFIYIGGASESFALVTLLFLVVVLLFAYFYVKYEKKRMMYSGMLFSAYPTEFNRFSRRKMLVAAMLLSLSFVVTYMASGNQVRESCLPPHDFLLAFFITLKALGKTILFKFLPKTHYYFICFMVFAYIGQRSNEEEQRSSFPFKRFLLSFLVLYFFVFVGLFPTSYLLSEMGPDRTLLQVVLFAFIFTAGWGFYLGRYFLQSHMVRMLLRYSLVVLLFLLSYHVVNEYKTEKNYAEALDFRIAVLKKLNAKDNQDKIAVSPLPPSGMLYSAEITSDANHFSNRYFKEGLELNFEVICVQKNK